MKRETQLKIKRAVDLLSATICLMLLTPLMASVALLILVAIGRPVIFRQRRPGLNEKLFYLYKFRTMRDAVDASGRPLPDAERLTRVGQRIRSLSLDELPQLYNIVRGELSLVGPRPLRVRYLERYSPEQRRRHLVKPGITGWAQINGRNAISWEEKFRLDVWYVDNWSLALDIKILFLTVLKVIRREGISQGGQETMPEFMGNQEDQR
jgi:lipopolysaccharide/colanic/teichoic acid biosynthesis glycosyltransferase